MVGRGYRSLAPFTLFAIILMLGFLAIGSPFESMFYPSMFLITLVFQTLANMSFRSIGIDLPPGWKRSTSIHYSVAMILVSFHVAVATVIGGLVISSPIIFPFEAAALLIVAQVAQFGVGSFEEYTFRGYMLTATEIHGRKFSILFSSISFASLHVFAVLPYGYPVESIILFIINIFLGGVSLALIRLRTNSLIPPIAFHASWNFFGYHVFGLMESEAALFDATYLMPDIIVRFELGLISTAIFTVLILLLFFANYRSQKPDSDGQEISI
ncbi:MAG: lysostaphin resistance A-like protein [Candidatus Hodarchaeota archaeon]